jgi:hypothetical protein
MRKYKDIRFIRDAEGPGRVFVRGPAKNWPGPNSAQPGGRDTSRMSTAAHPFSPRLMSMRQQKERAAGAAARKALGIRGPGDSRPGSGGRKK